MATSSAFYATLEKTLHCPLCKNLYAGPHIPKNLPHCSHACCQPCLESIADKSKIAEFSQVNCPECGTSTYLTKEQIKQLKTNLHLWNIAQDYHRHMQQKKQQTLAEDMTRDMYKVPIQDEPEHFRFEDHPDYIEMRRQFSADATIPNIEHTYLEPKPSGKPTVGKPVGRPLPEPPTYDTPHPVSPPPQLTLNPSTGKKVVTDKRSATLPQASFGAEKPIQVAKFGNFEQVQAIAHTPDGLLAACDFKQSSVVIFERKSGKFKKKSKLELFDKNQHKPADVVIQTFQSAAKSSSLTGKLGTLTGSARKYRYLVARHTGVEVYSSQGKYEQTITPCKTDGICSVTITDNGRILMGDIKRFVITEHDSEGTLLDTVPIKTKPARIESLDGSRVAISHFRSGKVEIVDMATQSSVLTMNISEALGMCYLKKSNTILVCRSETSNKPGTILYNTGLVKQYCCKTGELRGTLIKDLYHPFDLAVTSDGYLAVADERNIIVYKGNTHKVSLYETYMDKM